MFRHQGKSRTQAHNLRLASLFSFVAGTVNISGFLEIKQLTTNVTGHFSHFINELANFQFWKGLIYIVFIFSFLSGAFVSSFLIEKFRANKKLNVYVIPTLIEVIILGSVPFFRDAEWLTHNLLGCVLLFAMGLQNSYVTKVSDAIVRTTHLTGLFTDLGIELAHLFYPNAYPEKKVLIQNIRLRLSIICFFFLGAIIGGYLYSKIHWHLHTLNLSALILLISLWYDDYRFKKVIKESHLKYQAVKKVE